MWYNSVMDNILEKLNEEQIKPVLQTEGPVLVLAGAGSGKTRVLTSRIAYLIEEKGVSPSNILAITFTNKAANEMKERLISMTDTAGMWVCTIHSMCVRILRQYAEELGMGANFSIYSETERASVIKQAFKESALDDDALLKKIKWHISNAKMLGLPPEKYATEYSYEHAIDEIIRVYSAYDEHLKKNNALDFDDLLLRAKKLLAENEEAREYLGGKFRYILVDEFQDTNAVQFDIIKYLSSVHGNLFAVGDDDQSIYGWRGAKIENILNFEKTFRSAHIYKLEQNYRSTKKILSLANDVIHHNGKRKDKTLWTENTEGAPVEYYEAPNETEEALYTVKTIASLVKSGAKLSDFAVLMRINALTRSYEQEFTKYGIAFKVFGGFKFYERKEVKDLIAYLRIINNPFDDEAAVRIINVPRRGIGEKTIDSLLSYAKSIDLSLYDALVDAPDMNFSPSTKTKLALFLDLIKKLIIDSQSLPVDELVRRVVSETKMRESFSSGSDEDVARLANIDEFINSVDEFVKLNDGASLSDYLNQVTLSSDTDDMDESEYVTLATIHSVKGLEFKDVFICGLEENIMPSSRSRDDKDSMEEERRLMYVAITRAKERLWLTRSLERFLYGRREPTAASCFVKEIEGDLEIKETAPRRGGYGDYYGGDYSEDYGGYGGRSRYRSGGYGSYGGGYGGGSYSRGRSEYSSYKRDDDYGARNTFGGSGERSYGYSASPKKSDGFSKNYSVSSRGSSRFTPQSAAPANHNDVSKFKVGQKVVHAKFGEGVVQRIKGNEKNPILEVAFGGYGVKQLSAALAPLKIIEN